MTVLYGAPLSPFVRKTMLALAYKGVEYDQVNVSPGDLPEGFLKMSPLGKIPAYRDDRVELADSSVICGYLDDKYPTPELLPFGAAQRARTRWYEEYADTALSQCVGKIFVQSVLNPLVLGRISDKNLVSQAVENELPECLDYLELELADKRYFVAGILTIADLAISSQLMGLRHADLSIDISRWPRLGTYLSRLYGKDIFQMQMQIEDKIIRRLKDLRAAA